MPRVGLSGLNFEEFALAVPLRVSRVEAGWVFFFKSESETSDQFPFCMGTEINR